jgi:hypothetical protein
MEGKFVYLKSENKRQQATIEGLNINTDSMRQQATIEHQLNRINDLENRQLQNRLKQIFLMISRLLKCKRRRPDEEQTTGE